MVASVAWKLIEPIPVFLLRKDKSQPKMALNKAIVPSDVSYIKASSVTSH